MSRRRWLLAGPALLTLLIPISAIVVTGCKSVTNTFRGPLELTIAAPQTDVFSVWVIVAPAKYLENIQQQAAAKETGYLTAASQENYRDFVLLTNKEHSWSEERSKVVAPGGSLISSVNPDKADKTVEVRIERAFADKSDDEVLLAVVAKFDDGTFDALKFAPSQASAIDDGHIGFGANRLVYSSLE